MQLDAPLLVIVSGAPGSGKTTLARRLSEDLRLPLLARDPLKEALADAMGNPEDVAASSRLGNGAYAVLYVGASALLEAGFGMVLESNFRHGRSELDLKPLLWRGNSCLIHCTAAREVLTARYEERFARGERHPAHRDDERAAGLAQDLEAGLFEPLALPIPIMVVDTTTTWSPPYPEIRDFATLPQAATWR